MPKTAVGLFKNPSVIENVIREIEATGLPRNEVRTLGEPLDLGATGVLGIPRVDFEVELYRELTRMGATKAESEAYINGLRRGGALVFATGSDDKVDKAAEIMNRNGAVETEETRTATEPQLPGLLREGVNPIHESSVQAGRTRQSGGACFFVW